MMFNTLKILSHCGNSWNTISNNSSKSDSRHSAPGEALQRSCRISARFFSTCFGILFKHVQTSSNFENQLRNWFWENFQSRKIGQMLGVWQSEPKTAPRWLAAGAKSCKPGPGNGREELCLEMSGDVRQHMKYFIHVLLLRSIKYNVVWCISIFQSYINDIIVFIVYIVARYNMLQHETNM